ncbi:leucine-rich repeat domain-containing protein [Metamycoplasma hominis]|uniref:leucine-rich repeat domain-containing protein n=1 Tax=Metamycoplasma hominis TaxID=2098 RepID=UPI0005C843E3|nr:leucine-rich repeat domain-containing protein [Metamycoplasma hominis]
MKNKKNSKIWLILSSISALTTILPLATISCDHKVKQNSKENKEDLNPDENKPNPKPEDKKPGTTPEVKPEDKPGTTPEVKPEDKPGTTPEVKPEDKPKPKPEPKPENPTKEEDLLNFRKNFKFELTKSNTWKITKFIGNDSKVTIPKEYQGKNITEIGNGAFSNSFINSVSITGSIKEIGERAFLGCRNLEEVILNEGLEKIGVRAFLNTKIESITIPDSVKEIGSLAFNFSKISHISINSNNKNFEIKDNFLIDKNNKKILAYLDKKTTKVTIPSSIKEIDESAFFGCRNLKEVILNEGLEKIRAGAFLNTKIESITIPDSVKEIDDWAFNFSKISHISINSNNKNLEIKDNFLIDKNNKKILAYLDKKTTKVTIPDSVKEIGKGAFSGCRNLKEVILNEGLEKIGEGALSIWDIRSILINPNNKNFEIKDNFLIDKNNKKILAYLDKKTTKVTIPDSVKEIGDSAFLGCRNLKEVILNEGLEKIGAAAFRSTKIESITIPSSLKEIGYLAFDFSIISHISINSYNKNFKIKDNFFIDKNNKKILAYLDKKTTKVTIPRSIKEIGKGAFSGCANLEELILNEGLEWIDALVFDFSKISHISVNPNNKNFEIKDNFFIDKNNKKILAYLDKKTTKVTIPSLIKEIGKGAFSGCANLKEVILNEGLEKIGDEAFSNTNIESITIPSSVKEIGKGAFSSCKNLEEVSLNEGLEKIGAEAFRSTKIESITIPDSVKEIGRKAFSSCKNLEEVSLNEGLERIDYGTFQDTNIESITIPGSVKEIGGYAFSDCENLKEIILNEGLEWIDASAFDFSKISHISINSNNKNFEIKDNFFIDKNNKKILAYLDKKTTKVTIPSSIKEIDKSTFSGCKNLKEVILNDGLERIDYGTFQDTNIESITIPGSVKEIGERAFCNCENLKEVILNEGLKKIGASAFPNTKIESITIPSSVKEIGESAFSNCKNLKEVIYKGDASNINWKNIGIDKTKIKIISSNN